MRVPWGTGEWQRVVVYGLGLSGRAAARLLRARGVEVVGVDARSAAALDLAELNRDPGVELLLDSEPEDLPWAVDGLVVSPGVPLDRPLIGAARRSGLPVIAEVELAFAFLNGPVVAITGSNGKSTTTALTGELLRAGGFQVEVCGNIGQPLSACVEGPPGRIFVVELSSFQLEAVANFHPQAAALLNISPDHLDRYPDLAAYAAAKRTLFSRQQTSDVAVINADDPMVASVALKARRRLFSRLGPVEDGCFLAEGRVLEVTPLEETVELFRSPDLPVAGVHNLENAMAAALLARAFKVEAGRLRTGLSAFQGLPHRLQLVAERCGVFWYDDSKGTNPAATLRSLEGFADGSVHLILGGRSKGTVFDSLEPMVRRKVRRLYLIGEAAEKLRQVLGGSVPSEVSGDLEHAIRAAAAAARTGETVLLSPACASFDQFRDFRERGERFGRLVAELDKEMDGQETGL